MKHLIFIALVALASSSSPNNLLHHSQPFDFHLDENPLKDLTSHSHSRGNSEHSDTEYFDLSYTFDNDTIFYPDQQFDFHLLRDVGPTINETANGYRYSYASWSFCMSEHGGTHIDAPFHFNKFGWRIAEIPLKRLVDVPAVVVDVEDQVFDLQHPDKFVLDVEHLREHESKFGKIPSGSVVIVNYGWGKYWPDKVRYMGWDNSTNLTGQARLHFPGMSGNAASWLVRERQIVGFGSDTASADIGNALDAVVHIILCENQVYIIENVAYLGNLLRETRSTGYHQSNKNCGQLRMHVLPMKTLGTGGPVRVVAYCRNW